MDEDKQIEQTPIHNAPQIEESKSDVSEPESGPDEQAPKKTEKDKTDQVMETGLKSLLSIFVASTVAVLDFTFLPVFRGTSEVFVHLVSVTIILIVFLSIWLLNKLAHRIIVAFSAVMIVGLLIAFRSVFIEQRTVYFIVDTSSNMAENLDAVNPILYFNAEAVPNKAEAGLIIVGSGIQGDKGCEDFIEVVEPSSRDQSIPRVQEISERFVDLPSNGYSNLQGAVLFAIDHLIERRGPHQILIITSHLDDRCGELDRSQIDQVISEHNLRVEIVPILVGEVSQEDLESLYAFANRVVPVDDPASIQIAVEQILKAPIFPYGQYYGTYDEPNGD